MNAREDLEKELWNLWLPRSCPGIVPFDPPCTWWKTTEGFAQDQFRQSDPLAYVLIHTVACPRVEHSLSNLHAQKIAAVLQTS